MKKYRIVILLLIGLFSCQAGGSIYSSEGSDDSSYYNYKRNIIFETTHGDCILRSGQGDRIEVHVEYQFDPAENGQVTIKEKSNSLVFIEEIKSVVGNTTYGKSTWKVTLPQNKEYNVHIRTHHGEISIDDLQGEFDVETHTGNITADNIRLCGKSIFSSINTGEIKIGLCEKADHDLYVKSNHSDAVLVCENSSIFGTFELSKAIYGDGILGAPFEFETEEILESQDEYSFFDSNTGEYERKKYLVKSFVRGSSDPKITISTSTGSAILRERY
ncbi:MAG: hypothetical protein GY863_09015 [bacterium]|nr:hypothetical protein [bacterium]